MFRKIRIGLAVFLFAFVTLLFLDFTGVVHTYFGWMAKVQFLPAVLALNFAVVALLVLLTLIFGRVYCSVICPLGVLQDVFAWFGKKSKKNRYSFSDEKKLLRYAVLALFVLLMIIPGASAFAAIIAPYSAYGRIVSSLFSPIYYYGNNLLTMLAERYDSYAFYTVDVWVKSIPVLAVSLIMLVLVAYLSFRNGRTYCNTICPVGTVLGFASRFSWFKPVIVKDKCVSCGLCAKNCKSSCIDPQSHSIDYSRCVSCFDCLEKCSKKAIEYKHASSVVASENVDESRRKFFTVAGLTTVALASNAQKKVDGGLALIEDKKMPDRAVQPKPAGALSVKNFSQHCTSCQLCVSACPNGVLRPSSGLDGFMQPIMSFERGYCRPECVKCSSVCPAGAIKPISVEEKSSIQIGRAVWVEANCLASSKGVACDSCATHCPVAAISLVEKGSSRIPVVNTSRCIGCGACENLCPARPFSGIYVEGNDVHIDI